jgi:hypothetical protein
MYPNIKPWVTGNISAGLKARVTAYKEWEKRTRYNLQLDIKQEKLEYRRKGLQTITDYIGKPSREMPSDTAFQSS